MMLTTPRPGGALLSHMPPIDRIHTDKNPPRKHFIPEWAEFRGLKQKDIVAALDADKSTVARWFNGQMPQDKWLRPLAALLATNINGLYRHPDDDWIARMFDGRSQDEKAKIRQTIENIVELMPKKRA